MRPDRWVEWADFVTSLFLDAAACAGAEIDALTQGWNSYSRGIMFYVCDCPVAKAVEGQDVLTWSAHRGEPNASGWCLEEDLPAGDTPRSIILDALAQR
jgi:hypothetical protein